jgi:hypothetical protein
VVHQRDLHRGVHRLAARVDEEDAVQALRACTRDALRQLERLGMRAQERRGEVQRLQLLVHRLGDLLSAVAGGHAEQPRRRVDDLAPVGRVEVHALGAREQPRLGLELLVRAVGLNLWFGGIQ